MNKIQAIFKKIRNLSYCNYKAALGLVVLFNFVVFLILTKNNAPLSLLICLGAICFFASLIALLPKRVDQIILSFLFLIIYIYLAAQHVYAIAFQQYFLFATAFGSIDEMMGVKSSVTELFDLKFYVILTYAIFQIILFLLPNTKEKASIKGYSQSLKVGSITALLTVFLFSMLSVSMNIEKNKTDALNYYGTSHYFFNYLPNTNVVVEHFGIFGLLYRDTIGRLFIHYDSQYGIDDEMIRYVLSQNEITSTNKVNKYTGIFEGKSLVIIQAESLMNSAIDEELTPTMYRLQQEGLSFPNFNAPLLYGSTSDSEFMANTGLIPVSTGEITYDSYNGDEFPTTLAKLFNTKGYYSSAYHSNYGNYYSRDIMLPNLGFDFFDKVRLDVDFLELDSVVLDKIKWVYNWAPQYFSYFITYNGHQPYELSQCEGYSEDYYARVERKFPEISEEMKCYYVKNMDLDLGIERYVEEIIANNSEVVLMIFGDHNAKGIELSASTEKNFTPMIIWEKSITPEVIDKKASPVDFLPTLANMFNLEYDRRTVFGSDIMDEEYEGFCFDSQGRIITSDFIYNINHNSLEMLTEKYSANEARQMINQYILKMNVSRTVVETDFFSRYPGYGIEK